MAYISESGDRLRGTIKLQHNLQKYKHNTPKFSPNLFLSTPPMLTDIPHRIVEHLQKPFINEEGAENVRNYDYHGEDHSKIVKYMQPFWNKCATFIPPHISPNIVTMMGYSIALLGCILVVNFGRANPWVSFILFYFLSISTLPHALFFSLVRFLAFMA